MILSKVWTTTRQLVWRANPGDPIFRVVPGVLPLANVDAAVGSVFKTGWFARQAW